MRSGRRRVHLPQAAVAVVFALAAVLRAEAGAAASEPLPLTGVNLAGAEFRCAYKLGSYGKCYIYPSAADVEYFLAHGMNVFRLPFRWERLQPRLGGELDATELSRIEAFVALATAKGARVILDPHNHARYAGDIISSAEVPVDAFADFWSRLAARFAGKRRVIFGLMNEPHGLPAAEWRKAVDAAILAIREAGAANLVLVPGTAWSGAHSWLKAANGDALRGIRDPADNYAFELHQYLDADSSGTSGDCKSEEVGVKRLRAVTGWLRETGGRGFLAEFGAGDGAVCLAALDRMLGYMEANADVWLGWTYWAGGPWWGDYHFSVQPTDGRDRPQMAVLARYGDDDD